LAGRATPRIPVSFTAKNLVFHRIGTAQLASPPVRCYVTLPL
jgi:hypothetical protein